MPILKIPILTIKNRKATQPLESAIAPTLFSKYRPMEGGQQEFWESAAVFGNEERSLPLEAIWRCVLLRGGIGSGKSHVGAAWACTRAYFDSSSRGLISANDYPQLRTSTLVALVEFCQEFGIPLSPLADTVEETAEAIASRQRCKIFDATVFVISASRFGGETLKAKQSGRGMEIAWFWGDEWGYTSKVAFEVINGRIGRGKGVIPGQGLITSSINRNNPYNWLYEVFDAPGRSDEIKALYSSVNCLTEDNLSLPSGYAQALSATYSPELRAIELMGEYARITEGLIFKYFLRKKMVTHLSYSPALPLHISFDFNHNPSTALVAQVKDNILLVIREYFLTNSDTFELAGKVASDIKLLSPTSRIFVYGDASGNQRTANSKVTNWAIVRSAFASRQMAATYRYPKANPSVNDTLNSCSCLFVQSRVQIGVSCHELIKDLEFLTFDRNGGIDKKTDPMRSHLADCFRYLVYSLFPYKVPTAGASVFAGGEIKKLN